MTDNIPAVDKISGDDPASKIWGKIKPGAVFWSEVIAPENQALYDGDERAQKLETKDLRSIRRKMRRVQDALAVWEFKTYPKRLKYYRHLIGQAQNAGQRRELQTQYNDLKKNPPARLANRRRWFWQPKPLVVESEKQAQKYRLWMDRVNKRLKEHETACRNQQIYDELAREMQLEVAYFAQRIIHRWTALQHREEVYIKGKRKFVRVGIEKAIYTEDEIQYKIKVSAQTLLGAARPQLPDGVIAWNLVKPDTLSELTAACERPVGSPHTENNPETFQNGAWVVVYREGLTDGLFDYVDYSNVITKYNPENRDRFPVPIGVRRGRIVEWLYLDEHPHLMVNGMTGSGKSNVFRVALTTWVQYHAPDEIRLFLVDLKRGGDFRRFANVPHLAAPIYNTTDQLEELSPQLVALMHDRMSAFNDTATRDILDYNRQFPDKKMPRVVVAIDETLAINALASKASLEIIWTGLTLISTQARAAGIHLLLGTQQAFTDSIPKSVRDNITFILSGRQRTIHASIATFGTGRAKNLPKIRGRMWCDDGGDLFQVQTPFVTTDDESAAAAIAKQYGDFELLSLPAPDASETAPALDGSAPTPDASETAPAFGVYDVAQIAVEQFAGVLSRDKIHKVVPRGVGARDVAAFIKEIAENEIFEMNDQRYYVLPFGKGWRLELDQSEQDEYQELELAGD